MGNKEEYFKEIYEEYYTKIYDYIYYRVNNKETAEDLTSDVFFSVYKNLHTYDNSKSFIATWLYAIAANRLKNYYKSRKPNTNNIDAMIENNQELQLGNFDGIQQKETEIVLECLMEKLPERNKRIVWMKYYRSMTSREIAEVMHVSPGNVRIILKRSLALLKKMLENNRL